MFTPLNTNYVVVSRMAESRYVKLNEGFFFRETEMKIQKWFYTPAHTLVKWKILLY